MDAVVEGTVLRSRNQVRITAQLIEARADKHRGVSSRRAALRQNRLLDLPCQQHRNLSCENRDQRRAFTVPDALGNKIIHPYGDFLLHNIGTGDGIVQNPPQDTANKLRAVPLWGLRMHPRHMHDLRSLTLEDAIERHRGEADEVRERFHGLSPTERQQLITFLNSL